MWESMLDSDLRASIILSSSNLLVFMAKSCGRQQEWCGVDGRWGGREGSNSPYLFCDLCPDHKSNNLHFQDVHINYNLVHASTGHPALVLGYPE